MDITNDHYRDMKKTSSEVMEELVKLKATYKQQSEIFIYEVQNLNKLINDQVN